MGETKNKDNNTISSDGCNDNIIEHSEEFERSIQDTNLSVQLMNSGVKNTTKLPLIHTATSKVDGNASDSSEGEVTDIPQSNESLSTGISLPKIGGGSSESAAQDPELMMQQQSSNLCEGNKNDQVSDESNNNMNTSDDSDKVEDILAAAAATVAMYTKQPPPPPPLAEQQPQSIPIAADTVSSSGDSKNGKSNSTNGYIYSHRSPSPVVKHKKFLKSNLEVEISGDDVGNDDKNDTSEPAEISAVARTPRDHVSTKLRPLPTPKYSDAAMTAASEAAMAAAAEAVSLTVTPRPKLVGENVESISDSTGVEEVNIANESKSRSRNNNDGDKQDVSQQKPLQQALEKDGEFHKTVVRVENISNKKESQNEREELKRHSQKAQEYLNGAFRTIMIIAGAGNDAAEEDKRDDDSAAFLDEMSVEWNRMESMLFSMQTLISNTKAIMGGEDSPNSPFPLKTLRKSIINEETKLAEIEISQKKKKANIKTAKLDNSNLKESDGTLPSNVRSEKEAKSNSEALGAPCPIPSSVRNKNKTLTLPTATLRTKSLQLTTTYEQQEDLYGCVIGMEATASPRQVHIATAALKKKAKNKKEEEEKRQDDSSGEEDDEGKKIIAASIGSCSNGKDSIIGDTVNDIDSEVAVVDDIGDETIEEDNTGSEDERSGAINEIDKDIVDKGDINDDHQHAFPDPEKVHNSLVVMNRSASHNILSSCPFDAARDAATEIIGTATATPAAARAAGVASKAAAHVANAIIETTNYNPLNVSASEDQKSATISIGCRGGEISLTLEDCGMLGINDVCDIKDMLDLEDPLPLSPSRDSNLARLEIEDERISNSDETNGGPTQIIPSNSAANNDFAESMNNETSVSLETSDNIEDKDDCSSDSNDDEVNNIDNTESNQVEDDELLLLQQQHQLKRIDSTAHHSVGLLCALNFQNMLSGDNEEPINLPQPIHDPQLEDMKKQFSSLSPSQSEQQLALPSNNTRKLSSSGSIIDKVASIVSVSPGISRLLECDVPAEVVDEVIDNDSDDRMDVSPSRFFSSNSPDAKLMRKLYSHLLPLGIVQDGIDVETDAARWIDDNDDGFETMDVSLSQLERLELEYRATIDALRISSESSLLRSASGGCKDIVKNIEPPPPPPPQLPNTQFSNSNPMPSPVSQASRQVSVVSSEVEEEVILDEGNEELGISASVSLLHNTIMSSSFREESGGSIHVKEEGQLTEFDADVANDKESFEVIQSQVTELENDAVINTSNEAFEKDLAMAEKLLDQDEARARAVEESVMLGGGEEACGIDIDLDARSDDANFSMPHEVQADDGHGSDEVITPIIYAGSGVEGGRLISSNDNSDDVADAEELEWIESQLEESDIAMEREENEYIDEEVIEDLDQEKQHQGYLPAVQSMGAGKPGDLEQFHLPIIFESRKTGFEPTKDLNLVPGMIVANQYLVKDELGRSGAFSVAYRCIDLAVEDVEHYDNEVCLKVIKNTKDYFDQSLDEIKVLEVVRQTGQCDEKNLLEMRSFFYYKEHLVIVTELLRQNLYEFGKFIRDNDEIPYFTISRLCHITRQSLVALDFIHKLGLIHSDIKPENILLSSYSRARVKVIDFGSSCFGTDRLSSYIQSRSYRAPEVILGLPYTGKIDLWSLGCVIAEMFTGYVTFQNDSIVSMLSRIECICGTFPRHLVANGKHSHNYFMPSGLLYEKRGNGEDDQNREDSTTSVGADADGDNEYTVFRPMVTTMAERLGFDFDLMSSGSAGSEDEALFTDFMRCILTVDPDARPTASEALRHPWILSGMSMTDDDIRYPPDET